MDPEIKNILLENLRISSENNQMLQKVIKAQRMAQIYKIVYWVIILMVSFGSFYFIQPYIGNILNLYSGASASLGGMEDLSKTLPDSAHLQDLIKQLNASQ